MIIPTYSTKNSFKHNIFKLIVSVEVVCIIIIIIIIIIFSFKTTRKQWLLQTVFGVIVDLKPLNSVQPFGDPPFRGTK